MWSNMNTSYQGQGVAPDTFSGHTHIPIPLPTIPPGSNTVGGGLQNIPNILAPIPPSFVDPSTATFTDLAEIIAWHGREAGITAAVQWHRTHSQPNPPAHDELCRRVAVETVGVDNTEIYHQDRPNALALRLLAPRPGQRFGFEDRSTTNQHGKRETIKYKCLAPGCDFLGRCKDRHMDGQHVRDVDDALCCPYKGCKQIYYKSRGSQMTKHCKTHEAKNRKLQSEGKAAILLSSFQRGSRRIGNMIN